MCSGYNFLICLPSQKFVFDFYFFGRKQIYIFKRMESWILIKLQCGTTYQWIRLDELYKLKESFFKLVFEILAVNQKFWLKTVKYSKE